MKYQFANNAVSTLQIALEADETIIYISGDDAEEFPIPSDFACGTGFMLTLQDIREDKMEIVRCVSRSGRRLTIDRAEEGTDALDFNVGTVVSNRVTSGTLDYIMDRVDNFHEVWLGSFATAPVKDKNGCNLKAGMLYYNTSTKHMYVFDGNDWVSDADNPFALDSKLYYVVAPGDAPQTLFSGLDIFGNTLALDVNSKQPITVHVNGVELVPDGGTTVGDYVIDYTLSTITLSQGVPAATIVSFSLFTDPDTMRPAGMVSWPVRAFNIGVVSGLPDAFDDVETTFPILDDATGDPLAPRSAREMIVSVDGVLQEPGVDFLVVSTDIIFAIAPKPTARPWAFLYGAPGSGAGGTIDHTQLINRGLDNQHVIGSVTGLQDALDAKGPAVHTHLAADITDLLTNIYTKTQTDAADALNAPAVHTHLEADVTDLDKYTQAETNAIAVPAGGAINTVLTKASATNNDVAWGYALEVITQVAYDALSPPDANTLYFILE